MKRQQPEFLLHCVIADYLRAQYPALLWTHPANGEKRDERAGARLKRMGMRPGVPDLLLFFNNTFAAIELKADKGTLGDTQKEFMRQWLGAGGKYAVCRSLEDLQICFGLWGVPKVQILPTANAIGYRPDNVIRSKRKGKSAD